MITAAQIRFVFKYHLVSKVDIKAIYKVQSNRTTFIKKILFPEFLMGKVFLFTLDSDSVFEVRYHQLKAVGAKKNLEVMNGLHS